MKKILFCLILLILVFVPSSTFAYATGSDAESEAKLTIYLFYSEECPHCHKEREWLKSYTKEHPEVKVKYYEREANSELLSSVRKSLSIKNSYVPLTVIGSDYFIGYNDDIQKQIDEATFSYKNSDDFCDIVSLVEDGKDIAGCKTKNNGIYAMSSYRILPIIGEVNIKEMSLPIMAIIIGLVDGFNPCAMWVLVFLITMMLEMKNRKKMWILGITFLISSAFVYLLFMMSWLGISSFFSTTWFRYLIGIVAIIASLINLRKFLKEKKKPIGCTTTSNKQRVGIINKIEHIVKEKSLWIAVFGMIALAFSVNVIELACSAGLPLLFTQILSMNFLGGLEYLFYMGLYIFFFLLDDLIVFIVAMVTLKATGISNKYTKYSHLIGGIIMLLIGILLIVKPSWIMFNF